MSSDYGSPKEIVAADLFDGRLLRFGIREHANGETDGRNYRMLTDGSNYLHVWIDDDGIVQGFTRYGPNGTPAFIFACIAREFDTNILIDNQEGVGIMALNDGDQPMTEDDIHHAIRRAVNKAIIMGFSLDQVIEITKDNYEMSISDAAEMISRHWDRG